MSTASKPTASKSTASKSTASKSTASKPSPAQPASPRLTSPSPLTASHNARSQGRLLARIGLITDTHVRAPGGDRSSPFPVNLKANARARYAVNLLAAQAPEVSFHLGDIVHVLPHMPEYAQAAAEAERILAPLKPALHRIPGNHDIGDKPSPGMPAKAATPASVATYTQTFGASWRHVVHQVALTPDHGEAAAAPLEIHVLLVNASIVNSGLPAEAEQRAWLEAQLAALEGARIFVLSHYPPFIAAPDEQDHYDNYAEPGRRWFLDLMAAHKVEAVFSGHVHHYFFNEDRGVAYYCLPPTSFIRQDYAELFPTLPAAEHGRDDEGKYAVSVLQIYEHGHTLRVLPTRGRERSDDDDARAEIKAQGQTERQAERQGQGQAQATLDAPTPRRFDGLIPHLRHAWAEPRSLPYNGPMEEFARKRVRNDYGLLRLQQMGIDVVRVPLSDAMSPQISARMAQVARLGLRFVVFSLGLPDKRGLQTLNALGEQLHALEVVVARSEAEPTWAALRGVSDLLQRPCWISALTSFDAMVEADPKYAAHPFAHTVSCGFLARELAAGLPWLKAASAPAPTPAPAPRPLTTPVPALANDGATSPARAGVVVQCPWGDDPADVISALAAFTQPRGLTGVVNLRLSHVDPAVANTDDEAIARTLGAALRSAAQHGCTLQCDTFEDVDRGYHPRHGLVNRRGNLRFWDDDEA
ncbi:MAG: metallophosphoesterase [Pseudomonadota bacterium]